MAQRGWRAQFTTRRRDAVFLRDSDVGEFPVGARGRRRRQPRRHQPRRTLSLPVLRQKVSASQLSEEARTGKAMDFSSDFSNCVIDYC